MLPFLGTLTSVTAAQIPLSSFATSGSVTALAGNVAALTGQVQANYAKLSTEIADFSAMAAAMHGMAPRPGYSNRFGMNFTVVQNHPAGAFNFVHVMDDNVDFNAGVALSGRYVMGQFGGGISF